MTTYLSVQLAARRLGVSPHTIRRWTSSGFLPCTRTPGGHRRIAQEDIDELSGLIGGGSRLSARFARERELETLASTSLAVSSQLDLARLLAEIARQMTALLDCDSCSISEFDAGPRTVHMLANYDGSGRRRPNWEPFPTKRFPVTDEVLDDQRIVVINVSDLRADAAYLAYLRHAGSRNVTLVPLVFQGRSIGLIELIDHERERRFSRQELRVCRTVAAQAAVALNNAKLFDRLRRRSTDVSQLCFAIEQVAAALPRLAAQTTVAALLKEAATVACEALAAVSAVATYAGEAAGAAAPRWPERQAAAAAATRSDSANVLTAAASAEGRELAVTVTLPGPPADGQTQLLTLVCAAAAASLTRCGGPGEA
jgi:excisionase family DNA binding protein